MDKPYSSRKQRCRQDFRARFLAGVAFLACLAIGPLTVHAITLLQSDALKIGKKIWQNECNGTVSGLTSWNEGENFASLGIGHFIWYTAGMQGPFEESFPALVSFIAAHGAKLPSLLLATGEVHCLWNSWKACCILSVTTIRVGDCFRSWNKCPGRRQMRSKNSPTRPRKY